jgi:hypothetical protein
MKSTFLVIIICSCLLLSCNHESIQLASLELSSKNYMANGYKQLKEIRENGKISFEFIYDTENKLVKLNKYYADTISLSECYEYQNDLLTKRIHSGFIDTYFYNKYDLMTSKESYYPKTDKHWNEIYQYNNSNQIIKAITYYNANEDGYIDYKYDSKGNVTERKQYSKSKKGSNFLLSEMRLNYDNKVNPLKNLVIFPIEMIQKNNVSSYYYYLAIMSSYPPEYTSSFEYDPEGYPIKEHRTYSSNRGPNNSTVLEYTYSK